MANETMNPPEHMDDDAALAAAATPMLAKVGGGFLLGTGAITDLTAVQTLSMGLVIRGAWAAAPWVLLVLGLVAIVLGLRLMRARAGAAVAASAFAGVLFLVSGGWLVFSLSGGLFSLFALGDPFLAFCALAFSIASIGPCAKVDVARERLAARGLGLGL